MIDEFWIDGAMSGASIVHADGNEELEDNDESTIVGLQDVLLSLKGFEAAFPQTMLVLWIAATLGISSSGCEVVLLC